MADKAFFLVFIIVFQSFTAQSTNRNLVVKNIDNAILLEAYKKSIDDVSHGQYLDASFGLLKSLEVEGINQINDADVVDQWAQVMSTITNYPTYNRAKNADFHVPQEQILQLKQSNAIPAIDEIVKRARQTRIVILNENHLDPRGRAFGLEVAKALKPLGYSVLAMEAFRAAADDNDERRRMEQLMKDGVVRAAGDYYSGYYLDDPVFADFVRQSVALGYRTVSYETAVRGYSDAEREEAQADNLIRRGINPFPDAKILVYVGERHAAEHPIASEEKTYLKMAAILKSKTGIDPLTIDQAGLSEIPMNRPDVDLYKIAKTKAPKISMVLVDQGTSLTIGLLAAAVDLQVVHPISKLQYGRPDWLLKMNRIPSPIPKNLIPKSGLRLVQAFIADSPLDARPIDQVLVKPKDKKVYLLLPKNAKVRFSIQDYPSESALHK